MDLDQDIYHFPLVEGLDSAKAPTQTFSFQIAHKAYVLNVGKEEMTESGARRQVQAFTFLIEDVELANFVRPGDKIVWIDPVTAIEWWVDVKAIGDMGGQQCKWSITGNGRRKE